MSEVQVRRPATRYGGWRRVGLGISAPDANGFSQVISDSFLGALTDPAPNDSRVFSISVHDAHSLAPSLLYTYQNPQIQVEKELKYDLSDCTDNSGTVNRFFKIKCQGGRKDRLLFAYDLKPDKQTSLARESENSGHTFFTAGSLDVSNPFRAGLLDNLNCSPPSNNATTSGQSSETGTGHPDPSTGGGFEESGGSIPTLTDLTIQ